MKQLYGFIPGNRLNLRQAPDQSSPRLTLIPSRTILVLQEHNEAWYKTTYGALCGYVMKKFIRIDVGSNTLLHMHLPNASSHIQIGTIGAGIYGGLV